MPWIVYLTRRREIFLLIVAVCFSQSPTLYAANDGLTGENVSNRFFQLRIFRGLEYFEEFLCQKYKRSEGESNAIVFSVKNTTKVS